MPDWESINLAAGDELVFGPATAAAHVAIKVHSTEPPNFVVRDALAYRQAEIERLRARVAELEADRAATADEIGDQIFERIRHLVGVDLPA